jgi:polyisoprenoid-binding protein YceI
MIVGTGRKKPVGSTATREEALALIRSMLAYAGTYTVDSAAKAVTHHIDTSWDQSRTGDSRVRAYRWEGERLILTTQPSNDPASGRTTFRTLVWQRLK